MTVFLFFVAAFLITAAIYGRYQKKANYKRFEALFRKNFGQIPEKEISLERYAKIPAYFLRHKKEDQIDDITWNDLNLDDVFERIDNTQSAAGEEYLYYLLRTPDAGDNDLVTDEIIRYFEDPSSEDVRIRLMLALRLLGHTGKYSLYEYLDLLDNLGEQPLWPHLAAALLPFAAFAVMLADVRTGALLLIASVVYSFVSYFRKKREMEPYIVSFRYLLRMIEAGEEILRVDCPVLKKSCDELSSGLKELSGFKRGSFLLTYDTQSASSGNPLDILLDYLRIFFHLDLIKFCLMLKTVRDKADRVDRVLTVLGSIDTVICIAGFRLSLPYWCVPEFMENEAPFTAADMYHPLLTDPVGNSITADAPVLLTGSNASGKSTFLKSAALAALLAQTICTVCASSYRAPRYRVYSSMALRDDIDSGESYFIVEIRSLKRILDATAEAEGKRPVICCIDEVLRGTNTIERIAASAEILKCFSERKVMCFAATHDLELASILEGSFDNYHFEEEIRDGDVFFSYKLKDGKATTRNAIRLLSALGYDEDIVKAAGDRALRFMESGVWS
ncbi:MAG: hypothetical protein J6P87_06990 [Lachnospiraceae bacterium]|nr:hypothetical protein [Lachnospiraceae bacterium]